MRTKFFYGADGEISQEETFEENGERYGTASYSNPHKDTIVVLWDPFFTTRTFKYINLGDSTRLAQTFDSDGITLLHCSDFKYTICGLEVINNSLSCTLEDNHLIEFIDENCSHIETNVDDYGNLIWRREYMLDRKIILKIR